MNCKQPGCDKETGACPGGECKAGYLGDKCEDGEWSLFNTEHLETFISDISLAACISNVPLEPQLGCIASYVL